MKTRCKRCKRPSDYCFCFAFKQIKTSTHICILQHPKERFHPFNTGRVLLDSLQNASLWWGEDFSNHTLLNEFLNNKSVAVLYLCDNSTIINKENSKLYDVIILLDASWKKSFKMFQLSQNLHKYDLLSLDVQKNSQYQLRKSKKKGALSTLESCFELLQTLEAKNNHTHLLDNFNKMIEKNL